MVCRRVRACPSSERLKTRSIASRFTQNRILYLRYAGCPEGDKTLSAPDSDGSMLMSFDLSAAAYAVPRTWEPRAEPSAFPHQ